MAQYKTENITIDGRNLPISKDGKALGLKLQSTGITGHITDRVNKTRTALSKVRRFNNLPLAIKTTLVKTLIVPILEYPPIPMCSSSRTQQRKLHRTLNRAMRFIYKNENREMLLAEMYDETGITPVNISLHKKANKI